MRVQSLPISFSLKKYQTSTSWVPKCKNHDCNIVGKRSKCCFLHGYGELFFTLYSFDSLLI